MKLNKSVFALAIPLVVIIVTVVILLIRHDEKDENIILGMFETTTVNVASEIPGRVDVIFVDLGDRVEKGQLLATLEPSIMNAKMGQASGIRNAAESMLKRTKQGTRKEEIEAAKNQYQMTKSQFEFADKTYKRFLVLYADSIISKQEMDEMEFKYTASKNEMEATDAIYTLAKIGASREDIQIVEGEAEAASAMYKEAKAYHEQLEIIAPVSGEISSKIAEEGEVMSAGYPILTIMIPEKIYALANVREDKLEAFKKGRILRGKVPGLGGNEYEFEVSYLAVMADFATWVPTQAKGDFDLKTFAVRLIPVNPIEGLRPGMTVQLAY
ncbi:MAG: efflux RND transporter periplasmic adaptor subunit [Bacteroidetes bacterium]|nr:efflux RND transporter periplasmic adaptor subunit [Bacteroidota bacterium]MBL6944556.1 efflux RND transporter periplasmic adaptor subunit [Bacteroidales bacterium]